MQRNKQGMAGTGKEDKHRQGRIGRRGKEKSSAVARREERIFLYTTAAAMRARHARVF